MSNTAIAPAEVVRRYFELDADRDIDAIVALFAANRDAGTIALDGRMLDRPHLVQAERLLARRRG